MKVNYTCPYCGTIMDELEDQCPYCGAKNSSFTKKVIVENKEISEKEKQKTYVFKKQYNFALISLVCGVLSFFTMFGPGLLLGVVSIIFGVLSWSNKQVRKKAIIGMSFSVASMLLFFVLFCGFLISEFL